jgi:hypothetical protein
MVLTTSSRTAGLAAFTIRGNVLLYLLIHQLKPVYTGKLVQSQSLNSVVLSSTGAGANYTPLQSGRKLGGRTMLVLRAPQCTKHLLRVAIVTATEALHQRNALTSRRLRRLALWTPPHRLDLVGHPLGLRLCRRLVYVLPPPVRQNLHLQHLHACMCPPSTRFSRRLCRQGLRTPTSL